MMLAMRRCSSRATHHRAVALGCLFVLLAVAWSCTPASSGGARHGQARGRSPAPVSPIGHHGRWLVDASGRALLLRGVNFVMKGAPYYPSAAGFDEDDVVWLKDHGFDAVRLGVTGAGVMPNPGQVDHTMLDRLAATVDLLAKHKIFVLLDLHQDGWGERANGEALGSDGFPEWMTLTNGATNTHTGFPLYYVTNPAIQASFQSLWDNANGPDNVALQSSVANMFGALAERFGHNRWVLGYDVFNEPWPGTADFQPCLSAGGCADLDAQYLGPLYATTTEAIRASDRTHLVFGEPWVLFNFGAGPTHIALPGGDAKSGLSFHMYTVDVASEPAVARHAIDWSKQTGGALLATEWGALTDPAAITRQANVLDTALIPWMYWSYDEGLIRDPHVAPAGDNVNPDVVGAVVRPHPVAVAGTPRTMSYDAATKVFSFSWSTTRASGHGRFPRHTVTSASVPKLVYPDGYRVEASGAKVTSPPCAPVLTLTTKAGVKSVSVRVLPGGKC
jgi:endoglycosylceramidase